MLIIVAAKIYISMDEMEIITNGYYRDVRCYEDVESLESIIEDFRKNTEVDSMDTIKEIEEAIELLRVGDIQQAIFLADY